MKIKFNGKTNFGHVPIGITLFHPLYSPSLTFAPSVRPPLFPFANLPVFPVIDQNFLSYSHEFALIPSTKREYQYPESATIG